MSDLTVYEKPACTTCRSPAALLIERRIDFERVNYFIDQPDRVRGDRAVLARPPESVLELLD